MRRRLTFLLVSLVAGALIVAGAGALLVTRQTALTTADRQLRRQGEVLATAAAESRSAQLVARLGRILRLEASRVVTISPSGRLLTPPPDGLSVVANDVTKLAEGRSVSGVRGALAWAAVPVRFTNGFEIPDGDSYAIVLTRPVPDLVPGWYFLLLVGAATLLLTAAVAVALSRRLSRPLVDASEATARIAQGELSTRLASSRSGLPELDSLAAAINAMAARLEDSREHERRLLMTVSHDLRTPLTSIRGYAEAIEEGVTNDPSGAARVIMAEARRLERLVGDLLELAKLDSHQLTLELRPVELHGAAREVLESMSQVAESRGLTLTLDEAAGATTALADEGRLMQVLSNLVQNAVDFATSEVMVSVGGDVTTAELAVTDDGPGIAPDERDRIFDRFYQVRSRQPVHRDRPGSGLGLSIVAELVRAMGGAVRVESAPSGRGACFLISLPRAAGAPAPAMAGA